ncbi:uncharacterized protein LOC115687298 [Syzygium oleosum]|uniref:uncharacterized protein LOC115687298 n=1 Tax=Syzygium oleosum TaxID=219896 RepID=UPI0011D2C09A|nr:uncharacterized protein LOC115687298 [Syzygium oleosum]
MGDQAEEKVGTPHAKQQALLCQECEKSPSKYKCPACSFRSCSLPCVNAHKHRTGCSGKRNQTQFVPLSQFNDNVLLSDYNLLEEVKRVTESAHRTRTKLSVHPYFKLPFPLQNLRRAAASRRTKLLFLPSGLAKRGRNQSRYEQRKKFISWTIEWRFHSTDVVLCDHGMHEDMTLCTVIEKHLKPGPWNHQLKQFCDEQLDNLRFFIRKYPKGPKSPFKELDIRTPLRQLLANVVILEYPVIHIFLPSHSCDFEVVKDGRAITPKSDLQCSVGSDNSNVDGVRFREEIIEDNGCSESRVCDLMQQRNSSRESQFSHQITKSSSWPLAGHVSGLSEPLPSNVGDSGIIEDMEIDFDQGLLDAYSNLIAQMNPDDFLELDDEFARKGLEERTGLPGGCNLASVEDELEEGEILE